MSHQKVDKQEFVKIDILLLLFAQMKGVKEA